MTSGEDKVKRALVTFAVEQALLEFGTPALKEAASRLFDYYHCEISDCFEKPEYLKKVLKDLYGNSYTVILESIKKNLEEFAFQEPIQGFLRQLVSQ